MSVIYKRSEREREREWDTTSQRTGSGAPASYTTVRRYKMPNHNHSLEEDTYESEMRLVHRGRDDYDERRSTKDYAIERNDETVRDVREYRYVEREPEPRGRDVHEYRIERTIERSPSPETVREIRISRDYEREQEIPRQHQHPFELEKYSRSTEYFRPEQQQQQPIIIHNEAPQPIIFREEAPQPIIIREREPTYELIERAEVKEERQVARPRHDEDYYYERRIKEIDRGGHRESRYADEREYGRDRYGDRNYYSDDDVVYVHKEKDTWENETHVKRDVAAGALAGVAAGQIVRHHRKRKGEAPGGNIGNALGYGALGAVSAVALDKFNNRDRSRSLSSDRGRGRRHRSRSRHRSKSRVKEIGTLAAIAGVGALAYAAGRKNKKNNNNNTTTVIEKTHRSRSRSRRGRGRSRSKSVTVVEKDRSRSRSKHTDPEHRNHRAAQVGLASAAVAGLVSHRRSKSRKREGKRSPSRVRQGVPIAAAGVAGAAVTGLYEKHKAKKEAREASRSKSRSRSRSRSVLSRLTGRSRSKRRGSTASEPILVEYGGDPIYTDPASRSRSRRRRRRGSSSSSDRHDRRGSRSRSRSKSRARTVAETAAVAGVAGLAAHEAAKRRDRKKAEKEAERRREEDSAYSTGTYSPSYDSPPPHSAHPNDSRYFPETNYFPPPPTGTVHHDPNAPYPPYNPADYSQAPPLNYAPPPAGYVNPPHEDMNYGNPYAPHHQQPDPHYQTRRPEDNVSAPVPANSGNEHITFASARGGWRPMPAHVIDRDTNGLPDRVNEPEAPSPSQAREKTVQFDLNPQEEPSRETTPDREHESKEARRERRQKRHHDDDDRSRSSKDSHKSRNRHRRDDSPGSDASDATIELPNRFDELGRKKAEDPLADKLESVLQTLFR